MITERLSRMTLKLLANYGQSAVRKLLNGHPKALAKHLTTRSSGNIGNPITDKLARLAIRVIEPDTPSSQPLIAEVARLGTELEQAQATILALNAQAKQLIRRAEAAEKLGQTDALTQLYNRGFGDIALSQAISTAVRYDQPLSLIIFDIDYFKKINDCFGHSVGDKVLFEVATTIKNTLRSADIPFRYGGEEFVVILPDTQISGAKIVAEKIRAAVEALQLNSKGKQITVTISGGIAILNKDEVSENLISRADSALYRAKENGRNQIETAEQLAA
ncbi:MAG: GGDEF domain-containing protein [Candidatus Margulisiibacteriota bacterium]